jgi:Fur family ferric uptake transcriptional regulator
LLKLSLNKHTEEKWIMTPQAAILQDATERLRDYLRGQRLRLTPERLALLRAALGHPGHFDADAMVAQLRRRRRPVSRATIYRTLGLLERCGILRKSLLGQGRGLYERALGRAHHDHIVCAACGRIEEFCDERVERLQDEVAAGLGFRILDHIHELFGLCATCAEGAPDNGRAGAARKKG